jgi:hypothetical protein
LDGGINLYAYVGSNPVNKIDIEGKNPAAIHAFVKMSKRPDYSDLYKHCYIMCSGTRYSLTPYGVGAAQMSAVGVFVELSGAKGAYKENRNEKNKSIIESLKDAWADFDRDYTSDRAGVKCGQYLCESCEECCSSYAGGKTWK